MIKLNKRHVIFGRPRWPPGLGAASSFAQDLAGLNDPPAFGEMALGPDTAKVTVIEYASASCPHCANFYNKTFLTLKKEYIDTGKIRFVFREFPHQDAALAAFMLARCAPKEKYFPLIDMFFATQQEWRRTRSTGSTRLRSRPASPRKVSMPA